MQFRPASALHQTVSIQYPGSAEAEQLSSKKNLLYVRFPGGPTSSTAVAIGRSCGEVLRGQAHRIDSGCAVAVRRRLCLADASQQPSRERYRSMTRRTCSSASAARRTVRSRVSLAKRRNGRYRGDEATSLDGKLWPATVRRLRGRVVSWRRTTRCVCSAPSSPVRSNPPVASSVMARQLLDASTSSSSNGKGDLAKCRAPP